MNSQQEVLVQKRQVQERCDYEVKRRESPRFGSPGGHFFDFIEKTMPPSLLFPMSGKKAVTRLAKGRQLRQAVGRNARAFCGTQSHLEEGSRCNARFNRPSPEWKACYGTID